MKSISIKFEKMSEIETEVNYLELYADSEINKHSPHIHRECEIYLNLSGNISFNVENRIYPVSRGSVIITRPYEYHHCIYNSNELHRHYCINFSGDESQDFLSLFFERENGANNLLHLSDNSLNDLCIVLNDLLDENIDLLQKRILFLRVFQILSTGKRETYVDNFENLPIDVSCALHYMDNHICDDLSIKTLAEACHISVNTLERHFRDALGVSPSTMLRKKRLFLSIEYLKGSDSVYEVSMKSGFSDYSHYIQMFKKQFGITPLQYKKLVEKV